MNNEVIREVIEARRTPGAAREALLQRKKPAQEFPQGKFLIIAADHPARGAFTAGADTRAMANRWDLLDRVSTAVKVPGVGGYLGSADTVEDLALMHALDEKWVFGSMNRGAVLGARWELDDRHTGYTAESIAQLDLTGGKMLVRIDPDDSGSLNTLEWAGHTVSELAARQRIAMVEPFMSHRLDHKVTNDLSTDAVVTSAAIASGLGDTSSYTWLKLPDTENVEQLAEATTLPIVILGGEVKNDEAATFARWEKLVSLPNVIGLVVGRSLLYPPSGDVRSAVERAAEIVK